jgi:hypothetical protein
MGLDVNRLRERGVLSIGINNAGAYAPVTAHTFGDEQIKFHSAMFLDPKVMSFVPFGKLFYPIQVKHAGQFYPTNIKPCDCPNVYGFSRESNYDAATFLTTLYAQWGNGHAEAEAKGTYRRLCTMLFGFRLLHYLGCPRIYLIGADFNVPSAESGVPGYAWGDKASCNNKIWFKIERYMQEIKPVMEAAGVTTYNCNPESKCEAFDYVSFDDAVTDCKGPVGDEPLDVNGWYAKKEARKQWESHPQLLSVADVVALQRAERTMMATQLATMSRRDIIGLIDSFGLTNGAILGAATDRGDFASLCLEHSRLHHLHAIDRWRVEYFALGEPECQLKLSRYADRVTTWKMPTADALQTAIDKQLSFDFLYSFVDLEKLQREWYTKPIATGIVAGSCVKRLSKKHDIRYVNNMQAVSAITDALGVELYVTGGWWLSWWFVV